MDRSLPAQPEVATRAQGRLRVPNLMKRSTCFIRLGTLSSGAHAPDAGTKAAQIRLVVTLLNLLVIQAHLFASE